MQPTRMNPSVSRAACAAVLLAAGGVVVSARAAQPTGDAIVPAALNAEIAGVRRVLLDAEGRRRVVDILGLKDGVLQTRDPVGRPRAVAVASVVAILPPLEGVRQTVEWINLDGEQRGTLYLTDGQVLPGHVAPVVGAAEQVDWIATGPQLHSARFSIALERVAGARLGGSIGTPSAVRVKDQASTPALGPTPSKDIVTLANGDLAQGFVTRVGEVISLEVGGKTNDYPATRVDRVRLANPGARASGARLWLTGGAVVNVASVKPTETGGVAATIGDATGTPAGVWAWSDIAAYTNDASRLAPLAALTMRTREATSDTGDRVTIGETTTAALGAADVLIPGPMVAEWALPEQARRFSASLELPESCRRWGDPTVVIELVAGGGPARELFRERLTGDRAQAEVNVALDSAKAAASTLRIRVEAGDTGAIQDRVLIRQGVVLCEPRRP